MHQCSRGSIPDTKSYTIEQPAGRDWRHFHEVTLRWIGAIAILGVLAVLVIFYLARGMVRQIIPLGTETVEEPRDPWHLATKVPARRLELARPQGRWDRPALLRESARPAARRPPGSPLWAGTRRW